MDIAAFCSERKLQSFKITVHWKTGCEVQTCPVSVAACPGTLKVALCLPACLQQNARRLGSPEERCETLAVPSWLWAWLAACKERRRIQFLLAPGICLWRTWDSNRVLGKKKLSLLYQEMALKEDLLVTAPHCSDLFSGHTVTCYGHMCITAYIHKLICTYYTHRFTSWK